jgi:hypothetical protein
MCVNLGLESAGSRSMLSDFDKRSQSEASVVGVYVMVLGDVGFVYHALVIHKMGDVWGYVCKLMEVVGERQIDRMPCHPLYDAGLCPKAAPRHVAILGLLLCS